MSALLSIKEKLQKLKDDIDASEERESEAKATLREAEAREQSNLDEAESMRRRITLLTQELAKTDGRLEDVEDKLNNERDKTNVHEEVRRGLEDWELEGDEKIQEFEARLKEQEHSTKESNERLTEAERRDVVLRHDLEKAITKGESFEKRVEELTEILQNAAVRVKLLEEDEEEKFDREEENTEKIKFLEEQVKQSEQRFDIADREFHKLERTMDQVQTEIYHYNDLTEEQRKEMQELDDLDI